MQDNNTSDDMDLLISQYAADHLDAESFQRLRRWSDASPENLRHVREQLEAWFSAGMAAPEGYNGEEAYARFVRRVKQSGRKKRFAAASKALLRVAAVAALVVLPIAGFLKGKQNVTDSFSDIVVEAPAGGSLRMTLPDGSAVCLGADSRLTYTQGFGIATRHIALSGEAYFEVSKNAALPFVVQTTEIDVKVTGTKFRVKNYPADREANIMLLEGRVLVTDNIKQGDPIALERGEKLRLDKTTGQMSRQRAAITTATWQQGMIIFDETTLDDIARQLSRSFNVRIEVADSVRGKRFYGKFDVAGNTAEEILTVMSQTKQMRFRRENGAYLIY